MAAATKFLASSGGCTAVLNYDDILLTATGVTIDNSGGSEQIQFFIVVAGTTFSRTVPVGQSSTIIFPSALAVTLGIALNGAPSLIANGITSYGIGSG